MTEEKRGELLRQVLDRIKQLEGVSADAELAEPLGSNKRNVSAWKERESLPWGRLYDYCQRNNVSLEWVLNGRGAIQVTQLVAEPGAVYQLDTNQDVLYRIGADLYRALQETDLRITPDKFAQTARLLHRDMLDSGANQVSYAKVLEMVKLFS